MRRIASAASFLLLLVSLWSVVRIASFTIFDLFCPIVILMLVFVRMSGEGESRTDNIIPFIAQVILLCAGIVSLIPSTDPWQHIAKVFVIVVAMTAALTFCYLVTSRRILSYVSSMTAIMLSSLISGIVVILQGKFFILRNISVNLEGDDLGVLRPPGLTEHPIESGAVCAMGIVIGIALITASRDTFKSSRERSTVRILAVSSITINAVATMYSASLTAMIGLSAAILAFFLYSRKFGFFFSIMVPASLALVPVLTDPNSLLGDRVDKLMNSGENYTTIQTRQDQVKDVLNSIDLETVLVGKGYDSSKLPDGKDIHNGILSSLYHFGGLGLFSQILMLAFLIKKIFGRRFRDTRGLHLALLIIFLSLYLTGPVLARRSNWIAVLMSAFIGSAVVTAAPRRTKDQVAGLPMGRATIGRGV